MRTRRLLPSSLLLLALLVLASSTAVAQQTTGTISGTVNDETGAVLPGVAVTVRNLDTGIVRAVVTDKEGRYRASSLALGQYEVHGELSGFSKAGRRGIRLTVGREAVVNMTLQLGEITEDVLVVGDVPLVETRSAEMSAPVSREQMADLPLMSRDYSQLISLQAGTAFVRHQEGNAGAGFGARISVSGSRVTSNVLTLDGTTIETAVGMLPAGVTQATLGLEALQEFKVLTSNYGARHGRMAGANILAVTRAGTNRLRGTAYWYHRNSVFDAKNFFQVEKPDLTRHQFGASAGGPIIKEKTFFFANYEGLRERLPLALIGHVPTVAARQGILPGRTVSVDPIVKPYLNLFPLPTGRDFGDGTAEYQRSANQPTDSYYLTARVDHHFSPNTKLFVRYTNEDSQQVSPDLIELYATESRSAGHYATAELTTVLSPRLVNEARIGFTRKLDYQDRIDVNPVDPALSSYVGRPFGSILITGVDELSGFGGIIPRQYVVNSLQFQDDATFAAGRHSVEFGASVTRMLYDLHAVSRAGAAWAFASLDDFLRNARPSSMRVMGFNSDPDRIFVQMLTALYAEDAYQVHRNATLSLGLRFEYMTVPTERYGRVSNIRNLFTDSAPTVGDPFYENPGGFFAPRIGLAWDPKGDARTSVRTGFGVFYEPVSMKHYATAAVRQPPFWNDVSPLANELTGLFPDLNPHLERLSQARTGIHWFQYDAEHTYAMQWSLSVQRMLPADLMAEVGYTGARGIHLLNQQHFSVVRPVFINGETYYPPTETQFVNPNFGRIEGRTQGGASEYHAFKATVRKRYAAGLHFQGAYTWSKALDNGSAATSGELPRTGVMDPFNQQRDWGPAEFHIGHVFTGSFSYELPWGRDLHGVAAGLLRDWQVSGIFTATTGTPFNITSHERLTHPLNQGTHYRPDLIAGGNTNPVLGGPDRYFDASQFLRQKQGFYGNLGRNTMEGPGLMTGDVSLTKNFPIGGEKKLQFRAEFFNVANRPNFHVPASAVFDSAGRPVGSAGRISRTATPARQVQLALRFEF